MKNKIKIAFIGCGHMARAMIDGMTSPVNEAALKSNGDKFVITVADRHESKLMPIKSKCAVTLDAEEAVGVSDHVIVAIKPQGAEETLRALDLKDKTVISVMAGVSTGKLAELTGAKRIVRVMPNLGASVGESFNAYVARGMSGEVERIVIEILASFGLPVAVKESDMDAVTGITGSGPAFMFMAFKAFYDEAIARGFSAELAKTMTVQTALASALAVEGADCELDCLIRSVCSPGGTTERGVSFLEEKDLVGILRGAISRSVERSKELGAK